MNLKLIISNDFKLFLILLNKTLNISLVNYTLYKTYSESKNKLLFSPKKLLWKINDLEINSLSIPQTNKVKNKKDGAAPQG